VDADQLVSAKQHRWNANARAIAERPTLIRRRLYRAIDRNSELCDFSRGGLSSPWIEFGFTALPARRHDLPEIPDPFGAIRGPL